MTNIIAFIPARMGSTRFPGKPLADILGISMIEHVRRRVLLSPVFEKVVVATCDAEIKEHVTSNGGEVIMTSPDHPGCVDRVAEACASCDADVIVVVQGDEPLVQPEIFESLVRPFSQDKDVYCTNLINPITERIDYLNPNVVKITRDMKGDFLYLSREPIPSERKGGDVSAQIFKQLGLIAFRKDFLIEFSKMSRTPLEIIESVDMLRALEHGKKVRSVISDLPSIGVDTPEDLQRVIGLMHNDTLHGRYK